MNWLYLIVSCPQFKSNSTTHSPSAPILVVLNPIHSLLQNLIDLLDIILANVRPIHCMKSLFQISVTSNRITISISPIQSFKLIWA